MRHRSENLLFFYAAVAGFDEYIAKRTGEIVRDGIDWVYLTHTAETLSVAGGLRERLFKAGISENEFFSRLREIMLEEIRKTTSMRSLYLEISSILEKNGFMYIPLKGCDPRIYSGARDFFNIMEDIDILVKFADIENVGRVLEENGYIYQGTLSGSHLNFFTDEKIPRLIEIHWDLINRNNPIHRRLFRASIERIWERSSVLCAVSHLSLEDLLSYLTAHCVKEYFHKPKWLADIAWVIKNCSDEMDPVTSKEVIREWGTSKALGIIGHALNSLLCDNIFDAVWSLGAERPGFTGRYLSGRLLCYEKLRYLRPLIVTASASSLPRALTVSAGVIERCIRGR